MINNGRASNSNTKGPGFKFHDERVLPSENFHTHGMITGLVSPGVGHGVGVI